jgi:hypothetical protein
LDDLAYYVKDRVKRLVGVERQPDGRVGSEQSVVVTARADSDPQNVVIAHIRKDR